MLIGARTGAWAKSGGWSPVSGSCVYIEKGAQIDFGFYVGSNDEVVIDAFPSTSDIWAFLFRTSDDTDNSIWQICARYNSRYYGQSTALDTFGAYNAHKRCVFSQRGNVWYEKDVSTGVEKTLKKWNALTEEVLSSGTLKTAYHINSSYSFKGKLYHVSKLRNGELLNDLYPREIDGRAGMFDLVTGDFKTNTKNTGSIIYVE